MTIRPVTESEKEKYNAVVTHPLQSWEWGEFRKKEGVKVIRRGMYKGDKLMDGFQLTIHKIPYLPFNIGYLPKGNLPTPDIIDELKNIGREEKCIFIQLEPNVRQDEISDFNFTISNLHLRNAAHPLFTKYTFVLDLTKSEEELLKNMHPKTRYNIKVAQKHEVTVQEDNSDKAFERYWQLMEETTKRQQFYAHTKQYHLLQWQTLRTQKLKVPAQQDKFQNSYNSLTSHLLAAKYQEKMLTCWIIFVFHDTLYYPYGASSSEHRETMHSTLMMWEAIRFGKKLGLKKFDLWGAMGPNPDPKDPWYGFTRFKQNFGPEHVEFVGSYDLVINPFLYEGFKVADKLRWLYLKLKT